MLDAVKASIIVLLFIAAACLLVLFGRQKKQNEGLGYGQGGTASGPAASLGTTSALSEADAETRMRRRFLLMLAGVAAAIGALFVRLWSMQVVNGASYTSQAEQNRVTEYTTSAPRGRIYDRNGVELVGNRSSYVVLADSDVQYNEQVLRRLSAVLGIPREYLRAAAASETSGAQADRELAYDVEERAIAYISEHPTAFEGVSVQVQTVRTYPQGTLAAHVLGYTGTISESELTADATGMNYESGDTVGKDGVEKAFESYLQGTRGSKQVEVNASGEVVGTVETVDPDRGNDIRLTIDVDVQKVAEKALKTAYQDAAKAKYTNASAGAIVCMNCRNGEVIAMASSPTYDPSDFIGGISNDAWEELTDDASGYPLSNRCIAGLYPAASTFKGFTGLAGLEYGFASSSKTWNCAGTWTGFGEDWAQKCWNTSGHGLIGFYKGIVESCDTVFYEIAKSFYQYSENETALQEYLQSWGFGSQTGIELQGEQAGRVPTPEWKKAYNADAPESQAWQPGDLSNLIIGQGDLLVTPLQICCGYAGLATGRIPKPVLLREVLDEDGDEVVVSGKTFRGSNFSPEFKESNIQIMRNGFKGVVSEGSVSKVFSSLGVTTAGKTGTAEVAGKDNFAWYVGYGPATNPKYVCACCIEQGGSGATSAAPAVRSVLAKALGKKSTHVSGTTTAER